MIAYDELKKAFSEMKVLVVGDVMLDRYLTGSIDRISPEAPVPVFDLEEEYERLGGAANVALNIAEMGAQVVICGVIGKDGRGRQIKNLCLDRGINADLLFESNRCTTTKTRIIAGSQHILRVDHESTSALDPDESIQLASKVDEVLGDGSFDVVILQDYNKGLFSKIFIRALINAARKHGCLVSVDPKKDNFFEYREVDLFKPNIKELEMAFGRTVRPEMQDLKTVCNELESRLTNRCSLITLAERGIFCCKNGDHHLGEITPRQIVDVCGAGDAVIAISSMALRLGYDLETLCFLGNLAGGIVCEKVGVHPCTLHDLKRELPTV